MSAVRRFYYVRTPHGHVMHRLYGPLRECELTQCKRILSVDWLVPRARGKVPVCKQCEART